MADYVLDVIEAEILDTQLTEGFLCIEVEDKVIKSTITDDMVDTNEALPEMISELKKAGYVFYGDPTSECGSVELVKYTS